VDKHLEAFLEEFGEPTERIAASSDVIDRYRGKLPAKLLDYWRELGFSGFKNGLLWITNPDDFEDDLEAWLGDTPVVEEDAYYVIARSGFGDLYLWGTKNGHKYVVNPVNGWILKEDGDRAEIGAKGDEAPLKRLFVVLTTEYCDLKGDDKKPLFERAVAKLGPLTSDEVFAFEPALVAGGSRKLDHLAKRNVHVHLNILAQFGQREVLDQQALTRKAFG
jgi:hypothetical protein